MTAVATRPEAGAPATGRTGEQPLARTGTLIRFILRRDRIKLPAWLLGITLLLFYYAAALPAVYENDEQVQALGAFLEGPAGALLAGPGYGRDDLTIERVIVGVYGLYFLILAAVMNMLLVSRHTRVDEQNGRTELVRASVVGRHAPLTATLVVAAGANVLLALLLGGAMAANGYGGGQALLFGASIGAAGLVFAGVTALTTQVSEYSRAGTGIAGAALGAAYVIRAAGDMLSDRGSPLSWLSPLAWSQQTRPYVDGRWWPLVLSVVLAVAAAAGGYALSARRDLGAGLVAARSGNPAAPGWLRSPLAFAFRLHRTSIIWWSLALAATGLLYGSITQTMLETYQGMGDEMIEVLGGDRQRLLDGYLSVMALWTVLIVGVFLILGVHSVRSEETKGRAEPVLATATSRWAWFGGQLLVLAAGGAWLILVEGLATGIGTALATGDGALLREVTGAHLAYIPGGLVLLAVAALLFGLAPRAIGLAWVVLGYALFLSFFGRLMDLPQWAFNLSPLEHIGRVPLDPLSWPPTASLALLAAGLAAVGLAGFRRRDLEGK